jgi:hypothetical protein
MNSQEIAERIFMLRQAAKDMNAEADALARQNFSGRPQDTYEEGKFKVVVGRNARFDPNLVKKALAAGEITQEQYEAMLETKPSSAKAKEILPPVVYRSLQREDTNKVTITLPKDGE